VKIKKIYLYPSATYFTQQKIYKNILKIVLEIYCWLITERRTKVILFIYLFIKLNFFIITYFHCNLKLIFVLIYISHVFTLNYIHM